jgi:DNA polymerase III sliding clamp (beta) subunit (PCNA family)
VYHGTSAKFNILKDVDVKRSTMGNSVGFYFTSNEWTASRRSAMGNYIKVFLNIKNIIYLKKFSNDYDFISILGEELKSAKGLPDRAETYWFLKNGSAYRGVSDDNVGDVVKRLSLKKSIDGYCFPEFMSNEEGVVPVYVVFNSENVKLADGTNTTFDSVNPDIRFDDGGSVGVEINNPALKDELSNLEKTNYATGGNIKSNDVNMEGDSTEMIFDDGGQVISAEVFEWEKVPTNYRNTSKVKKVPFTNNPLDKGLDSIVSPFLGKDELKLSMNGINFDENGITATNAHILITLPYPNKKYDGIYDINKVKKQKSNELVLINENYPKYQNIIPEYKEAGVPYLVSVYKLLQYTKSAINYANKTSLAIAYKFGDNQVIGFNGKYLIEVLTTALKLGHEKIYVFISKNNRAILLSPNKEYELGNDELLLIMPLMLNTNYTTINGYGTEDLDYNRSLKAYYDFNDDEIHNADGSVAEFKMEYKNNLLVDDKYLALLSKITSKNNRIPILNYAKVENGRMTAFDLNVSLTIKDVNMPNGIYEIYKNAPNITMQPLDDFPKETIFYRDEYHTHFGQKRPTAFEFVTFSEVFEFYLDKLLLSVGKDDLRPVMSGICIKKTSNNELFLVTTNANTLCKINITEYCEFEKDDRELEYILPVKYLKDFVKLADGSLDFKCNLSNIFIDSDNLQFVARTIDGKYPNYEAVIPKQNDKMMVFDHVKMNNCLKSKEVVDAVSKYKADKSIFLELVNEGNILYLKVVKEIRFNTDYELIEKIKLCEIDFNYQKVNTNITYEQSLFLLMPVKDDFKQNQYFAFRKNFFDVMLETITDTEVECYFTEPNRAYIFPIDAIDYKKTLPEEKTKNQPKKIAKKKKEAETQEKKEIREAIETLMMLAEIQENAEDRKDIYEAIEILNLLKEDSYEYGGGLGKNLHFEPIKTPLN